jgi:hypothetical protein
MGPLASTHDFEIFVNPNANQRKIAKIAKIPGQDPHGQIPSPYGYYYIKWSNHVTTRFLERMPNGAAQPGKSIIRWVPGDGIESQIEYWDNT